MKRGHRFAVGDQVQVDHKSPTLAAGPGIYTIVKVLPDANRGLQYRAKNGIDPHEFILDDILIRRSNG